MYRCILLKFYIKPQHQGRSIRFASVVSYWNSTSNHNNRKQAAKTIRVVSYWNSTSNHNGVNATMSGSSVVSYWNSTSNHNPLLALVFLLPVVSYWNSTSNHNFYSHCFALVSLYLIEILHQTTTLPLFFRSGLKLYLIEILHQTTTPGQNVSRNNALYLIEILHQTTTRWSGFFAPRGCILLKFYIKPQPLKPLKRLCVVVSYWNSTSNHNK